MKLIDELREIDDQFRPMNYWGWLENLTDSETDWQIREMKRVGLGGFVAHARGGLEVSYMGKEWRSSVIQAVKTAKETGLSAIFDDEDGWPSGFGAGEVNGKGHYYQQKFLVFEEKNGSEIKISDRTLGIYKINNSSVVVLNVNKPLPDEILIHIFYEADKYYTDLSDAAVTRAFIDESYEKYAALCGEDFDGVYGIFSDEPQIARGRMQWSLALPAEFEKQCGYNLSDWLPCLFIDDLECGSRVRNDYYKTVSSMFTNNYARVIGEWCEKRGIAFISHTTCEEDFASQISCTGNTMPFYEYLTVPAMDWLCRTGLHTNIIKQLTSVAAQLGKPRVLSEMFGCSGWNISFEEMKWIAEWQMMYGVDFMLQHLGLYSLKGSRKREYPASLFYQQPWWDKFSPFNEYFARYSKLISISREETDVLVIHPIETAWIKKNDRNQTSLNEFNRDYKHFLDQLLWGGVNFHLGDSEIMRRHGHVCGDKLSVGNYHYSTVIIPACDNLSKDTLKILSEFAQNGGKIYSACEFPELCDSKIDIKALITKLRDTQVYIEHTDSSENQSILAVTRSIKDENRKFHIILNTDKFQAKTFSVNGIKENCAVLSLEDMRYTSVDLSKITLSPMQSVIIEENAEASDVLSVSGVPQHVVSIEHFKVKDVSPNALVLDCCEYAVDEGEMQESMPVIKLQQKLLKGGKNCDVMMRFIFTVVVIPENECFLCIEEPLKCDFIKINGEIIDLSDSGYWIDKSFRKISILRYMQTGNNEILIKRRFENTQHVYDIKNGGEIHEAEFNRTTVETEFEAIYITGNFSVHFDGKYIPANNNSYFADGQFTISQSVEETSAKSLTKDGFPFFAGKITLSALANIDKKYGSRVILDIQRPDCVVSSVRINASEEHDFLWAPYQYDITSLVNDRCENEIELTLYTSCRNLLGPHRNAEGESYAVGPHSYIYNQIAEKNKVALVNFGLPNGIQVLYI